MITIYNIERNKKERENKKMSANKIKIIVTVLWKNYITSSTRFEADPTYGGYRISEDGKFYYIHTIDGKACIPVENVQYIEQKNISA